MEQKDEQRRMKPGRICNGQRRHRDGRQRRRLGRGSIPHEVPTGFGVS
jgi:hypothetical protein